jgi:hypothetical protein
VNREVPVILPLSVGVCHALAKPRLNGSEPDAQARESSRDSAQYPCSRVGLQSMSELTYPKSDLVSSKSIVETVPLRTATSHRNVTRSF